MDRKGKRLAALLCAVLMAVTLLPGQVWAEMYSAEDAPLSATVVCSNPLYPELGVTESVTYDAPGTAMLAETNAMGDGGRYDSLTDVAAYVHQQFKAREQILFFYTGYPADGPFSELTAEEAAAAYSKSEKQLAADGVSHAGILLRRRFAKYLTTLVRQQLLPEVFRHDPQDPTGGDYMRYQYGSVTYSASWDGNYFGVTIAFTYFTTARQETELEQTAASLLDYLGVARMAEPEERLAAIYDWLCAHVENDSENRNDTTNLLKYSAYAALVNKRAVSQGYALLLYRLALAAGVDVRVVSGSVNAESHGWDLVKLGVRWYQADAAWDAGAQAHRHYLKASLSNHQPDGESAAVMGQHFLSPTDFTVKIGELNGSGGIDSTDVQLLYDYLVTGKASGGLSAADFRKAADINGDGAIDVYDLQLLYESVCGISE